MQVDITTPDDYSGGLISDANSRRGHILQMDPKQHLQVIQAEIPLSELFGYETDIRSLSQGRASSSMQFKHYEPVPPQMQKKILGLV